MRIEIIPAERDALLPALQARVEGLREIGSDDLPAAEELLESFTASAGQAIESHDFEEQIQILRSVAWGGLELSAKPRPGFAAPSIEGRDERIAYDQKLKAVVSACDAILGRIDPDRYP